MLDHLGMSGSWDIYDWSFGDKSFGDRKSFYSNFNPKYLSCQACCRDDSYHFENGRTLGIQRNWSQVAALLLEVVKNKRRMSVWGNQFTFLLSMTNFYFSRPREGLQSPESFLAVLALFSHFQKGKLGLCTRSESWDIYDWNWEVDFPCHQNFCLQNFKN